MPALRLQQIELQQNTDELRAQLRAELDECTDVQACYRNKIEKFMAAEGLRHIKDLDYPIRKRYAEFFRTQGRNRKKTSGNWTNWRLRFAITRSNFPASWTSGRSCNPASETN